MVASADGVAAEEDVDAARALQKYLVTPDAIATMRRHGLEAG